MCRDKATLGVYSHQSLRDLYFTMSLRAFVSSRVVTPEGVRSAAVLVEGERIRSVVAAQQGPPHAELLNFADAGILPGLVDSHVHTNDPGRADWDGFQTA